VIIYETTIALLKVNMNSVSDCKIISLPKFGNRNGNITSINNLVEIPFDINRVFYLYDIPGGESRGAHAHKECHQFLIAASGSFEVFLDDGTNSRKIIMNKPNEGLHILPEIWASESNFSSGSVCLVLASHVYCESDYLREYSQFKKYISNSIKNINSL
jgi:hypothetical protein